MAFMICNIVIVWVWTLIYTFFRWKISEIRKSTFFNTYIFQAGLVIILVKKFKTTIIITFIYLAFCIALHVHGMVCIYYNYNNNNGNNSNISYICLGNQRTPTMFVGVVALRYQLLITFSLSQVFGFRPLVSAPEVKLLVSLTCLYHQINHRINYIFYVKLITL